MRRGGLAKLAGFDWLGFLYVYKCNFICQISPLTSFGRNDGFHFSISLANDGLSL